MQPVARLLLNVRRICPLLLGFLQRGDLLLLTGDVAVQRRNLRALTEQLTRRRSERKRKGGNHHCEHRSASGERRLAVPRPFTISVAVNLKADVRRNTVVGRTAAGQRQPTTNRGNADAPA